MCQSSIICQIVELIYRTVMIFIFDCVTVQTENILGDRDLFSAHLFVT